MGAKVDAASAEFKIGFLTLSSTVSEQVAKVNKNIDATSAEVRSDAAEQAKVNANVNAEMTRMIKLGNDRYKEHLKDDVELQNLIAKDKAETDDKLNKMAESFNAALASVRKELAADRKHAEDSLKKSTSAVWAKLQANQAEQAKKNAEMEAATRRMRLDAMDAVREAKAAFRKKIAYLGEIVAENDKKADAKIKHLTGVVGEEAEKSRQGREELAALEEANKKELKKAINDAIATGEKRAKEVEAKGEKMDADTKWLVENKLKTEIDKLRDETNASVETLALMNKEARDQMKAEMLYAIRTAAEVAKADLDIAVRDGVKKMIAFQAKSAEVHATAAAGRADLKAEIAANATEIADEIQGAVAADAAAQKALGDETAKALEKTNKDITAYSDQMRAIALKTRADIKATNEKTLAAIKEEEERANGAIENFTAEDAARQEEARKFMEDELAIAAAATEKKFGDAYAHLADNRAEAEEAMATAFEGLNDSLAKQAALADSRFEKTVKDIAAARKQAADQVADFRKQFAAELSVTREMIRATESKLEYNVMKVAAEVKTLKQEQASVNAKVEEGLIHIENLSNKRLSENKAAAAAETAALKDHLEAELAKARKVNHDARIEMAKDLTEATEKFQEALGAQAKAQQAATDALNEEVTAAGVASANALAHAKTAFDSKIVMLTDTVVAHAKEAEEEFSRVTGVVEDYAEASELDRTLIKEETKAMEAELNHALDRAISIGEAKAKAVAQRIAEHLKDTKRYIQVELNDQVEAAADNVLKIVEGKRQVLADNYLSLKAYAVAAADDITDYVVKGKGRGLSSIGDLLSSVGLMGAVHAPERQGLGMGGDVLPSIFSGDTIKVSGSVAAINGLVNEYTTICGQVRERWPMGLGKYLLSKLEESMTDKGVLQVDKVEGKPGNFVFINGRSVGLSNKLSDFSTLAAKMTMYESVLAKMTSKITAPPAAAEQKPYMVPDTAFDEHAWPGN